MQIYFSLSVDHSVSWYGFIPDWDLLSLKSSRVRLSAVFTLGIFTMIEVWWLCHAANLAPVILFPWGCHSHASCDSLDEPRGVWATS